MQIDFSELGSYYFEISNIFPLEQTADGETTFTMQEPRPTDAFLLFVNTEGMCYQENLSPLYVPQGSLVYLPKNSRYVWKNSPAPDCNTQKNLLFEFSLSSKDTYSGAKRELCRVETVGENITFGDKVSIVSTQYTVLYEKLFMKLIDAFSQSENAQLPIFCAAYDILNTVSHNCRAEKNECADTEIIKNSIKYLDDTCAARA